MRLGNIWPLSGSPLSAKTCGKLGWLFSHAEHRRGNTIKLLGTGKGWSADMDDAKRWKEKRVEFAQAIVDLSERNGLRCMPEFIGSRERAPLAGERGIDFPINYVSWPDWEVGHALKVSQRTGQGEQVLWLLDYKYSGEGKPPPGEDLRSQHWWGGSQQAIDKLSELSKEMSANWGVVLLAGSAGKGYFANGPTLKARLSQTSKHTGKWYVVEREADNAGGPYSKFETLEKLFRILRLTQAPGSESTCP